MAPAFARSVQVADARIGSRGSMKAEDAFRKSGDLARRRRKAARRSERRVAGELRFQLGPARVEAVDGGLAFVDGGEQGDQLRGVARVLGLLARGARLAQRRLGV